MKINKLNRFLKAISYIIPNCLVPSVITEATIFQAILRLKLERNNAMYELEQYHKLCYAYINAYIGVVEFDEKLEELLQNTTMVD